MKSSGSFYDEYGTIHIPTEHLRNRKELGLTIRELTAWTHLTAKNKPKDKALRKMIEEAVFGSRTTKWRTIKNLQAKGYL